MIRISKIADYGTKILLAMAAQPEQKFAASELTALSKVALPTVSKILKELTKAGLLLSHRGSQGGYQLARAPGAISLAQIVSVLDGDIAMTECEHHMGCCEMEASCEVKDSWATISSVIYDVLQGISLQQMCKPLDRKEFPIQFIRNKVVA